MQDDPNKPNFEVPNIGLANPAEAIRLGDRVALRQSLDNLERSFDREGELGALDQFRNPGDDAPDQSADAESVRPEPGGSARPRPLRPESLGQQLLLARRLAEAGAEIITSSLNGPLCGRVSNWDDHAVNHHVFDALRFRARLTTRR